ncbi:hypothetical protein [Streptomyces sp. NPDC050560]|uniref:hypothetical protein n=1 Tax=Streptomyces sp. NPDC050560 TaxID=3365630 RepID=UPI0037B9145C
MAVELHVANELVDALKQYMHLLNVIEVGRREDPAHHTTVLTVAAPTAPKGAAMMSPTFELRDGRVLLSCVDWYDSDGRLLWTQGQRSRTRNW